MGEFSGGDERRRVVALCREPLLAQDLQGLLAPRVSCQAVSSPYEAAAEVLAEPPTVLVIDFRTISRCHLGLLGVARRMGVEMLGLGALPPGVSVEDLSGVRLVARDDLAVAVQKLTAASEAHAPAEPPAAVLSPATPPPATPPPAELSGAADAARTASLAPERSAGRRGKPARRRTKTKASRRARRPSGRSATTGTPAARPTGPPGPPEPQAQAEIPPGAAGEVDQPPRAGDGRAERQATAATAAAPKAADAGESRAQEASEQTPAAAPRPRDLLTPEELAALLEHES